MKLLTIILILLTCAANGQVFPPLLPPVQVPVVRTWKPVVFVQQTNIELQWNPYTNACFAISNSTDLTMTNWALCCYIPITATNAIIPTTNGNCFYKVATIYQQ